MPYINFNLEDGKPPVSFAIKPDDCERFAQFRAECKADKKDAERYRWLRNESEYAEHDGVVCIRMEDTRGHAQSIISEDELDAAIDQAMLANAKLNG